MKVKFDKKLNKYHIQFNKNSASEEKKEIYKKITSKYDISYHFDSEIDGQKSEQREESIKALIELMNKENIDFTLKEREVQTNKRIFGIPTPTKQKSTHYNIDAKIKKDTLSDEMIEFFSVHEIKIIFTDENGNEENFYDSNIFCKMFSTYDLSKL